MEVGDGLDSENKNKNILFSCWVSKATMNELLNYAKFKS